MSLPVPVPLETPAIQKAARANDRWMRALFLLVALTLVAVAALVVFRFSDQAKQSTTRLAAKRSLLVAERQDCRSEYNAIRTTILEDADAAARRSIEVTMGYLLGNRTTLDIATARDAAELANDKVGKLATLPDMVDNGFTDGTGKKYPPCPAVR